MNGVAIRQCQALGLHLRNESKKVSASSREIRYRVWWALYGLERHLGVLTGRPTSIVDHDCTAPLPSPFDEEIFASTPQDGEAIAPVRRISSQESATVQSSPSSTASVYNKQSMVAPSTPARSVSDLSKNITPSNSLFFYHYTTLSKLSHEVMNTLYSPHAMRRSWAETETTMQTLNRLADEWRASLPPVFDFTGPDPSPEFTRQRLTLFFCHQSIKIIIHRPCLCRVDTQIPNQSNASKEYNLHAAATCVKAALDMVGFLSDVRDPIGLYQNVPWWSILHYMMQTTTVLMMELSCGAYHMRYDVEKIFNSAKRAVYWFHRMADKSIAVQRAWKLSDEMLRKVAPKIGETVDDMPSEPPPLILSHIDDLSHSAHLMQGPDQHEFSQSTPGHLLYGQSQHPESYAGFNSIFHTSYDHLAPFREQADISQLFPTSIQMDSMARVVGDSTGVQQVLYPWGPNRPPS